ncbi:hypothetical protein V512_009140 [Mesotoga sp. Brook.08.105.5.1]|nr:hypothetical protein V512_009140 [Mesotoga sp. Brook.08.105.5.1]
MESEMVGMERQSSSMREERPLAEVNLEYGHLDLLPGA